MWKVLSEVNWPVAMTFIRDLIVSCAAIVTATVAYKGLHRWRMEEEGKADFDLARRIGKEVIRFRNAMANARRYGIEPNEFPGGQEPYDAAEKRAAYMQVFDKRLRPVDQSAAELESLVIEAEILWGTNIVNRIKELTSLSVWLRIAMKHVASKQKSGITYEEEPRDVLTRRAIDRSGYTPPDCVVEQDNEFTLQIQKCVENVNEILKGRLPKRTTRYGFANKALRRLRAVRRHLLRMGG